MITINGDTFTLSGSGGAVNSAFVAFGGAPSEDQRVADVSGKSSGGVPATLGTSVVRMPSLWLRIPGATDIFQSNTVSGVTGFGVDSEFDATTGSCFFKCFFDLEH